jgi:hypothetical protein
MLLRRMIDHVKNQNWTAVALDFAIVVMGVFIGIQVANWNETRTNKEGLTASLKRLDKEVTRNIDLIEEVLGYFEASRTDLRLARDALDSCTYTPEAQKALESLLFHFVEDVQPNLTFVALGQLAGEGRYQDLLSEAFQQAFGTYAGRLREEQDQLTNHYDKMWAHHINFHPDVSAYFPGDGYSTGAWGFKLNKPFEEICKDASFRNRFISTLGFYMSIGDRLARFKAEAEGFHRTLAEELERQ